MEFDFSELAGIIELNSHTRNKAGVDRNGAIFTKWMKALGFEVTTYHRDTIGNHLHFTTPTAPGRRVLLLGHLDTVYPQGSFEAFREDAQWIYGPGVCDMKGGYYAALCALRQLKDAQGAIVNIDMLMVSDEETGSDDSKHLTAELARDYDLCLVFEAAGRQGEVVIGRKGVATYRIALTGKAAHAGNHYQDGHNANLAAAQMLIALTELTDLDLGSTVNVGQMSGGIGANTISPEAHLLLEMRYTSVDERDRLLSNLQKIVDEPGVPGVVAKLSGGIQRDVMEPTWQQQELINELEGILGEKLRTECRGGVSDANIVAAAGVPTLDGFGPFGDGDHTIDERACKQSFVDRVDQITRILGAFNATTIKPYQSDAEHPGLKRCSL